jgi:hypothetical protein
MGEPCLATKYEIADQWGTVIDEEMTLDECGDIDVLEVRAM